MIVPQSLFEWDFIDNPNSIMYTGDLLIKRGLIKVRCKFHFYICKGRFIYAQHNIENLRMLTFAYGYRHIYLHFCDFRIRFYRKSNCIQGNSHFLKCQIKVGCKFQFGICEGGFTCARHETKILKTISMMTFTFMAIKIYLHFYGHLMAIRKTDYYTEYKTAISFIQTSKVTRRLC
jgi:hypothetical protein